MGFCISSCELQSLLHRAGLLRSLWAPDALSCFARFQKLSGNPSQAIEGQDSQRAQALLPTEAVTSCVELGHPAGRQALDLH